MDGSECFHVVNKHIPEH
jgi:hypothetical protein